MPKIIPPVPVPPGMKWCRHCGEVKTSQSFYIKRSAPDGRDARCRQCYPKRFNWTSYVSGINHMQQRRAEGGIQARGEQKEA